MVEPLVLTPKLFWSIAAVPIAALAAERMATLQKKKSKYEFKIHSNQYSLSSTPPITWKEFRVAAKTKS